LQSRSLAERVTRQLRLGSNIAFFEAHGVDLDKSGLFASTSNKPLTAKEQTKRDQLAIDLLLSKASIVPVRGSALVDISYTSASPTLSAQIANTWTNQFIVQSMDRRFASTADARKFLEGRLADLRARLETSERDLVTYANRKGIVALGKSESSDGKSQVERTLVSSDLESLNSSLARATADRIAAESKSRQPSGGANSEALNNIAIGQLRQKRAEIASEYAKIMVQFEPGYPEAKALGEQLAVLDTSIMREEARVLRSRSVEYREAVQRESDSIQYNIFQREADTNRELYDGLLQRYKEIGVAGIGSNNIAIVDPAEVPRNRSAPSLALNMALALLSGLALAAAATFGLEQIDEGLLSSDRMLMLVKQLLDHFDEIATSTSRIRIRRSGQGNMRFSYPDRTLTPSISPTSDTIL
jgi:succinoglycan biosynthesis transport protein ExoP